MSKPTVKITSDASKEDEIAFLSHIRSEIGVGTYLASLFTPELYDWASERIKNDLPCDLYGEFWHVRQQSVLAENSYREERGHLVKAVEQMQGEMEGERMRLTETMRLIGKRDSDIETMGVDYREIKNLLEDAQASLEQRDNIILKLKAQIFDLEHK